MGSRVQECNVRRIFDVGNDILSNCFWYTLILELDFCCYGCLGGCYYGLSWLVSKDLKEIMMNGGKARNGDCDNYGGLLFLVGFFILMPVFLEE